MRYIYTTQNALSFVEIYILHRIALQPCRQRRWLTESGRAQPQPVTKTNAAPLKAAYSFGGQQFDRMQVSNKGRRYDATMTTVHDVVTRSDSVYVALGTAGVAEYGKQKANGTFAVEVNLTGKVKYTVRYTKCKIEATCPLKLLVVARCAHLLQQVP
jgi:hypothetical protein